MISSPFQKRKGDTGGWFGGWQITSASPMWGRHDDVVSRSQILDLSRREAYSTTPFIFTHKPSFPQKTGERG
jgi:hypothetical protein